MTREEFFDALDDRPQTFVAIIAKVVTARYVEGGEYRLYAVTAENASAVEVAMPRGPFVFLGRAKTKPAADNKAAKFTNWLNQYNEGATL